jgi:spore coat polysaccharide biosynthesis protein SpsF
LKVVATIEARMAATRLPGKMLLPLAGASMLERLVERLRRAKSLTNIVVATTVAPSDDVIAALCARHGIAVYRGPVEDIATRILCAAGDADIIVQITGDCPLVDPEHVDRTVALLRSEKSDYASNGLGGGGFPLGLDVRCFTRAALEKTIALTDDPVDRVHGSYFIYRRADLFKLAGWDAPAEMHWPELRLTVDEPADYDVVRRIYDALYPANPAFTARDVITLMRARPEWVALNSTVRQKDPAQG